MGVGIVVGVGQLEVGMLQVCSVGHVAGIWQERCQASKVCGYGCGRFQNVSVGIVVGVIQVEVSLLQVFGY